MRNGQNAGGGRRFRSGDTRVDGLPDAVANALAERILATPLKAGDRLPSERDLCVEFGVSRSVVREAVRSLVAKGLIIPRIGRGLEVANVGAQTVAESLTLYLRGNRAIDYQQVSAVRSCLEVEMAGLAARSSDPARHEELSRLVAELASAAGAESAAPADVEFHRAIARMTGNDLFLVLLDSIGEILMQVRRAGFRTQESIAYAANAHRAISERIQAGDEQGARQAMREHLEESERRLRSSDP